MTIPASGVYNPDRSLLHTLQPAVKLVGYVLLVMAVLFTKGPVGHTAALIFTMALVYLAGLDRQRALAPVRRLGWLFAAVILVNFLFGGGEQPLFGFGIICAAQEGLWRGLGIALRLGMILVISAVLSSTTPALKLAGGIAQLLSPLSRLGVPAGKAAISLSASLRFVSALFEDADTIRLARRSRGMGGEKRGFLNVASAAQPLLVPLFVSAFKRAQTLSLSLEARGCGNDVKSLSAVCSAPNGADWLALLVCASVFALQALVF